MSEDVSLIIDGMAYGGWTGIEIATGLDAVASSFRIELTERWPGHSERWAIHAGDAAVVAIGGEPVITGYIDDLESDLSGVQHHIAVAGRSKSGDLVDCSAINSPGSWTNRSLEAIAADIAAPFGIGVEALTSTAPPFARFALQQGESAWDAIERMLRQRGLLAVTDSAGNIQIFSPEPGAASATISDGPLSVNARYDVADRFSRYVAKGQAAGTDDANGPVTAGPKGEATDPSVGRYRPLIVLAEDQASAASLAKRATWEATVRAGKSQTVTVTLTGWRAPDGALWRQGQLVQLLAASAWVDAPLLLTGVTYRLDNRGREVELRFCPPEAFSQLAIPDDAKPSSLQRQRPTARLGRIR